MAITRAHLVVIVGALGALYFIWAHIPTAPLQFQNHTSLLGFRDLLPQGYAPQSNLSVPLTQLPIAGAVSPQKSQQVCKALFEDSGSPSLGDVNSPIQIAVFLDYRCPYCKTLTSIISKLRTDKIRIVYKDWPILGDSSVLAARAAWAANKQGRYFVFHSRLMNTRFVPNAAYLDVIAVEFGLNIPQFHADMSSSAAALSIQDTAALASNLGFVGTPALVVGHTIVQGEITRSQLDQIIEGEPHLQFRKPC